MTRPKLPADVGRNARINVRATRRIHDEARRLAEAAGVSMADLIEGLIERAIAEAAKPAPPPRKRKPR